MTEEEKLAEEYAKTSTNCYKDCLVDIDDKSVLEEAIADAFIAGLKAGKELKFNELKEKALAIKERSEPIMAKYEPKE